MVLYLLRDSDANGGYYEAHPTKPDGPLLRRTVQEVRMVDDFPDDVWEFALQGGLPVDEDMSNDSTWAAWWPDGVTVWSK